MSWTTCRGGAAAGAAAATRRLALTDADQATAELQQLARSPDCQRPAAASLRDVQWQG
jgi:hypothetical protein